jgi:mannose-6-phosphate isomerase-like protein (cupin superfamily)
MPPRSPSSTLSTVTDARRRATMDAGLADEETVQRLPIAHPFDVTAVCDRLRETGGYEVVHSSPGLEVGVYVLVAPEADRQQPHADDEIYLVLEGRGVLDVEGKRMELSEGHAVFVPAGAEHHFSGYEQLIVLVIFESTRR